MYVLNVLFSDVQSYKIILNMQTKSEGTLHQLHEIRMHRCIGGQFGVESRHKLRTFTCGDNLSADFGQHLYPIAHFIYIRCADKRLSLTKKLPDCLP